MTAIPKESDETEDTIRLANKVLDRPWADLDDDLAMLSRQFLRGREIIAAKDAEIAALREALEPFAKIADFYDASPEHTRIDTQDIVMIVRPNGEAFHLTYNHCRDARVALRKGPTA